MSRDAELAEYLAGVRLTRRSRHAPGVRSRPPEQQKAQFSEPAAAPSYREVIANDLERRSDGHLFGHYSAPF